MGLVARHGVGRGGHYARVMPADRPCRRAPALICVLVLVLAACGGDDPELSGIEGPPTPRNTSTPVPEPTATSDPTPDQAAGDDTAAGEADGGGEAGADDPGTTDGSGGGAVVPTPTQGAVSGEPAFTAASKLTTVGLDEVFFGDPVDFAAEVASTTWTGLPPEGSRPQCFTVQPATGPTGIFFTVIDGFIERVDISNPIITTRSGAGVGSTEADLVELFGDRLDVTDVESGREVMFVPTDARDRQFRIIWTTDGATVVSMRAGRAPFVLASSPCG